MVLRFARIPALFLGVTGITMNIDRSLESGTYLCCAVTGCS